MNDIVKDYWENCKVDFAHLTPDRNLQDPSNKDYLDLLKELFIDHIEWEEKTIVDYGIGGGYLGKYLFEECNIKKYIGIDIAQRSLDFTNVTLKDCKIRLYLTPKDFSNLNADIFISIACIQHFPSKEYLDSFLVNLNNSGIKTLFLMFKYSEVSVFKNCYNEGKNVGGNCKTNKEYIMNFLEEYTLIDNVSNENERVVFCRLTNDSM